MIKNKISALMHNFFKYIILYIYNSVGSVKSWTKPNQTKTFSYHILKINLDLLLFLNFGQFFYQFSLV